MSEHKVNERERPDRMARVVAEQPKVYEPGVCGSCYWCRKKLQFGSLRDVCMALPKQVMAVAQSQGAQILSLNPVIENLGEELCAMWKPLQGDTQ